MRVRDVMTRSVVTVESGTAIVAAAEVITERGFTLLPVVDGMARLVGVVTEADLMRDRVHVDPRALLHGEPPRPQPDAHTIVADVMTTEVRTATANTDLADLTTLMLDTGLRSVPVVEGERLVGIVTRRDVLKAVCRDDRTIAADVRHRLARYGDSSRWQVRVRDSRVEVVDGHGDDELERHIVSVLVGAVPGVVGVDVHGPANQS